MKNAIKIVIILCLGLVLGYCIRGLWIKGIVIENRARLLSENMDQSFSRLGIKPQDISRQFYEERRVGIRKFVHTTKIFNLGRDISSDQFYQAIVEAVSDSNARLLEKTNFEAGDYSISIFVLGRRSISTHLLVGIKKKVLLETEEEAREEEVRETTLKKNKVAIIIDDTGYNRKVLDYISEIKVPLTLSVLPQLRFSQKVAHEGHNMGYEIILHLPLEPEEEIECLGPGAIFLNMGAQEMEKVLDDDIKTVPHCCGLNNHAGSRFTKDSERMKVLLGLAKKKNLFFVDSLVTPESLGFKLAKELGIPTASRDIFLDNVKDEKYILNQLKKLIEISRRKGSAIGIGHDSPITFKVLKENLYLFEEAVEFVHVSELLE